MEIYLVGGAVRDHLLQLPIKDRDWVVVGATANDLLQLGYQQVGKDFPVFLHPETKEEYALARTERKAGHGYTGFTVDASSTITLQQDLARRDLTINAIAQKISGEIIDPFHGQDDLKNGLLKHISPAFSEDPVRILRVARFAARYAQWGFKVAHSTHSLMKKMVSDGEVDHLVAERVWQELEKTLHEQQPDRFFHVLHACGALAVILPSIDTLLVHSSGHAEKTQPSKALTLLQSCCKQTTDPAIRLACLLRPLAPSPEHTTQAIEDLSSLFKKLKPPKEYQQLISISLRQQYNFLDILNTDNDRLLSLIEQTDAIRRPKRFHQFQQVCAAGEPDAIHQQRLDKTNNALKVIKDIPIEPLTAAGLKGKALINEIKRLRLEALNKLS